MISPTSRVTLVDFGIAKIMSNDATRSRTATGAVLGTPHYMSPEQALSRPLDARSDIYSAGVVLYHMVTGHRPFEGDSLFEVLRFQIEKAPVAPSELVELPADLEQIIMVAMAKPAEQRFASAAAMQLSLRQLQLDASWDVPRVKPGHLPPQLVLSGPTMAMDASQRPMVSAGVTTVLPTAATPTGAAPPAIAQTFQVASPIGKSSGGRTKVMLLVGAVLAAGGVAAFTFGPHADKPASATPPPAPALTLRSAEEAMVALQSKDPAKVAEANRVIQGDIDKASPFVASAGSAEVQVDGFLPYAVNAAHAVAPDAEFIALEFTDITKTGTITPGIGFSMASARFFSPALHVRPPDVKADAHWSPLSTIVVNVDFVGTRVMRIANEIRLPTLALPKCKASQLWQRASAVGAKPDAPAQTYQFSAATGGRWEWWGDQARQFADDCD
jgi:hypothetical protein